MLPNQVRTHNVAIMTDRCLIDVDLVLMTELSRYVITPHPPHIVHQLIAHRAATDVLMHK